jgi:hypothetical protein
MEMPPCNGLHKLEKSLSIAQDWEMQGLADSINAEIQFHIGNCLTCRPGGDCAIHANLLEQLDDARDRCDYVVEQSTITNLQLHRLDCPICAKMAAEDVA